MIQVAHVHAYRGDMTRAAYVGRPTIYGNPFRLKRPSFPAERRQVIDNFRAWWYDDAQRALRAQAAHELANVDVLLCWCSPQPCHAAVIAEWLNSLRQVPHVE